MNKIGLIGGTGPESTLIYYKELVYGVQKRAGTSYFPNLIIESLSVFEVLKFCEDKNYDGLTEYLLLGINNLAAAGAKYGALTGITPHIVFDRLQARSPIPLVSIIDTACEFSKKQNYKRVALLGTYPTMTGNFFQSAFSKEEIEVITPNNIEMQFIGQKISSELELGIIDPDTQKRFASIAEKIVEQEQAEAIVLGCTELPLIFAETELPVPCIDVMRVHIDKLIELAML
ncbi:MAG: amino acid racemase [Oscillospiraceae bacterium]|nr:amino acid racemase [Oscillospiraceae bacterium]